MTSNSSNANRSDILKDTTPSKDLAWWLPNIDHKITPEVRHTLETYSKIPSSGVAFHVYSIREKAWSIRPWPCTGLGGFLRPTLPSLPIYSSVVEDIKKGSKLIDIGCYAGTDLRHLFIDGCPQSSLFGTDFVNHWDIGFELFCDRERFSGVNYIPADILEPNKKLMALRGQMEFVSAVHLLHNWNWATQIKAATTIATLTKTGSKVIGAQVGTSSPDKFTWISPSLSHEGFTPHSVHSFKELWSEVGRVTNSQWEVEVEMRKWEDFGYGKEETQYLGKDAGMLQFVITRLW